MFYENYVLDLFKYGELVLMNWSRIYLFMVDIYIYNYCVMVLYIFT